MGENFSIVAVLEWLIFVIIGIHWRFDVFGRRLQIGQLFVDYFYCVFKGDRVVLQKFFQCF